MTPKQAKLAYFLFFSCFAVWLALILSVCFPSGRWTTPIIFPNYFMLALFIGSAVLSSIQAMLIGLHFLGIDFKIRKWKPNSSNALPSIRTRKYKLRSMPTSPKDSVKESEIKNPQIHVKNKEMRDSRKGKNKSKDYMKTFFLFGETEFNGCTFKFGHLKKLPKNKPIPDECFGCPEILECVTLSETQ